MYVYAYIPNKDPPSISQHSDAPLEKAARRRGVSGHLGHPGTSGPHGTAWSKAGQSQRAAAWCASGGAPPAVLRRARRPKTEELLAEVCPGKFC